MYDFGDTNLVKQDTDAIKGNICYIVAKIFQTNHPEEAEDMIDRFNEEYDKQIAEHADEDKNDFDKLARLINVFKPTLEIASVLLITLRRSIKIITLSLQFSANKGI